MAQVIPSAQQSSTAIPITRPDTREDGPQPLPQRAAGRVPAIDRLRGLVIILMVLDHVRDFFSYERISPTDLADTTPALFFTRWITHYCAPIFIFLAGVSGRLLARRLSRAALSRFLLARGVWLVVLEFTVVTFVWNFNFSYPVGLVMQVIWAIGMSMCVLAGLVFFQDLVISAVALLLIAGHNSLDGIEPETFGAAAPLWHVLHVAGRTPLGTTVYPLIPWVGVMAAGYVFGAVYQLAPARQRRVTVIAGLTVSTLFVLVRLLNVYGDPEPWLRQASPLFTLLSFLNVSKYPPSLAYVLMTLGPGLLALAAFERLPKRVSDVLQIVGGVPLFAYVVHLALAHLFAGVLALGMGLGPYVLTHMFTSQSQGWGFGLLGVYTAWLAILSVLLPLCRWFGAWKRGHAAWWVSYL